MEIRRSYKGLHRHCVNTASLCLFAAFSFGSGAGAGQQDTYRGTHSTIDFTCSALLYGSTAAFNVSLFCLIKDNKGQVSEKALRQGGFWR